MKKQEIKKLEKARKNAIDNCEILLYGNNCEFPTFEDIKKADNLIDIAMHIENILQGKMPLQSSETDREIELRAVKAELEQYKQKCKELEWDLRSYELTHEKAIAGEE